MWTMVMVSYVISCWPSSPVCTECCQWSVQLVTVGFPGGGERAPCSSCRGDHYWSLTRSPQPQTSTWAKIVKNILDFLGLNHGLVTGLFSLQEDGEYLWVFLVNSYWEHFPNNRGICPLFKHPVIVLAGLYTVDGHHDLSNGVRSHWTWTLAIPSQWEIEAGSGTLPGAECQVQDTDNSHLPSSPHRRMVDIVFSRKIKKETHR